MTRLEPSSPAGLRSAVTMRHRLSALLAAAAVAGCPQPRAYDNPPDLRLSATTIELQPPQSPAPAQPYFKTQRSSEWVSHNFRLQEKYARVLLVGEPKVTEIDVAPQIGRASCRERV